MSLIKKVDLKKGLLYKAKVGEVSEIVVPPANYLTVEGKGDPNTSEDYRNAIEALFAASYALKFHVKQDKGIDYSVMPLEGLWESKNADAHPSANRDGWSWTAMILQPEYVDERTFASVLEGVKRKKKGLAALNKISFTPYAEGRALQTMHVGPYAEEEEAISRLIKHAQDQGYALTGKHHEIYLNTPQKTSPDKLKTIIRQPVHAS